MSTDHEQTDHGTGSVRIENGIVISSEGAWELSKISGVYKRDGEQVSIARFVVLFAGVTAAQAAGTLIASAATGFAAMAVLGGGAMAYFLHRTKSVMILAESKEYEVSSEIYFPWIWLEDYANNQCDRVIEEIRKHLK